MATPVNLATELNARRALAVVNPAAGGGRAGRAWPALRRRLAAAGLVVEDALTRGRGEAMRLAAAGAAAGWPLVLAVGGDGTVNEVVDGALAAGPVGPVLGVIPLGRGRDVCRNLGLPLDAAAAADRVVGGETVAVDVGRAEWQGARPRYFVNSAGVGFDARVARRVQSGPGGGTWPYLRSVLATLVAHQPVSLSVQTDGRSRWTGPATSVVVANGPCYGGGMRIAPGADPADGLLDVVVLGALGRTELLRWLPSVYSGGHLACDKVTVHRGRHVLVDAPVPAPVQLDGEVVGETPVTVRVCPAGLRLRR